MKKKWTEKERKTAHKDRLKKMPREKVEVTIEFPNLSHEQLDHLFKAEAELRAAGVNFDTGFYIPEATRDWEFDWSLKGAEVYLHPKKEELHV